MKFLNSPGRKPVTRSRALHPRLESLEDRVVLSAVFDSAVSIGSAAGDAAFDVATDTAGNTVMTGYFSGTVDFDPAATHAGDTDIRTAGGNSDIYAAKYAADGSFLWVSQMAGATGSTSTARSVTTDASGNVYVGGDFTGTVSFGAYTLTSSVARDGFVAKLGSDGTVQWADRWGGADKEYVYGVAVDSAGNVLTAGATVKYNPDGSQVYCNLQVEKFSSTGTALWAKQIGNTNGGHESASGIGTDTAGNVYVSGAFRGTVDFDPGPSKHNVQAPLTDNGFVLKLTAAGGFGWVSPFISQTVTAYSDGLDLAMDGSGNIIVGGYSSGTVDFDPGHGTRTLPGNEGGFISQLNSAGSLVWVQQVGANSSVHSLALDASGNVYAQGLFGGQADFDPGTATNILTSNGGTDVFVTKYSAVGAYQWAVSFGGSGNDWSDGIAVDAAGDVYVAGWYFSTVDFDPDPLSTYALTSAGDNDIFRLKLKQR